MNHLFVFENQQATNLSSSLLLSSFKKLVSSNFKWRLLIDSDEIFITGLQQKIKTIMEDTDTPTGLEEPNEVENDSQTDPSPGSYQYEY